jgi:hypothetical protein
MTFPRFLFVVALALTAESFTYAQAPVPEADDAYHFKYWQGSPYNAAYNEWWYFNLYDTKNDLQAIFTYQVADPLNLTGQGGGDMTAVVYQGKKIISESDFYPLTSFTASYSAVNVSLGQNTISLAGPNTYLVAGSSLDGRLGWNLYYDRSAAPWFAGNHMNVAPPSWEQMSWLLYMPGAKVSGTLTVDGHTYRIDSPGYHDHNWGQWNFEGVLWNWAQYSRPGLAFDLGDFASNPNGRASIDIADKRIVFAASQYSLVHTKWAFDSQNQVSYPVQSIFTAQNGGVKVRIVMDVQKTEPLATGPPPSLVIYEQPAHFSGTITVDDPICPTKTPFEGDGFKEYTAISSATAAARVE